MRALTASELLNIWDRGEIHGPLRRVLELLAAAYPELTVDALAREPVGERDRRLLAVREHLFGARIESAASCPGCGEHLDVNFALDDIRVMPPYPAPEYNIDAGEYRVAFRLPDTVDVATAPAAEGADHVRSHLLARCLSGAERAGTPIAPAEIPAEVIERVLAAMGEADPQADVQIALTCPACRHEWSAIFDIVSFLWSEIDAWARRLMRDVHVLATAYGWSEADILALSPRRREIYMAMVT